MDAKDRRMIKKTIRGYKEVLKRLVHLHCELIMRRFCK